MSEVTRTVFLESGDKTLQLQAYTLRVVAGPNEGTSVESESRRFTIGTSPENDLTLDDPAISRFHASIEVNEQGYALKDEGSKNGTYIQDLRIGEIFLQDHTRFRIGETEIEFSTTEEEVSVRFSGKEQFGDLLGTSLEMREIFALLDRVSTTDATVLIEGESGTGKELVAEAVHAASDRSNGPLVVIDCSAIAGELIESELFGHEKGAFTGATSRRKGAFESAQGGTLFLDELGEMPLDLQPKLLRALEKREVKPVGSNTTIPIDVRIVAATNRNLIHEVKEGNFREDLYYRFAVIKVQLPPLRDRPEDIPLLVEHFLKSASKMAGRENIDIGYKTMEKLKNHKWQGNVRELKNFVERAVLLTQGNEIETRFLHADVAPEESETFSGGGGDVAREALDQNLPFKDAKNRLIEEFELAYWSNLLERTDGNVSKAGRIAGVHRKSVEYILKKLDLSRDDI